LGNAVARNDKFIALWRIPGLVKPARVARTKAGLGSGLWLDNLERSKNMTVRLLWFAKNNKNDENQEYLNLKLVGTC
jgi:hypothetical protein